MSWSREDKREAVLLDELKKYFENIPICPELDVCMVLPKEPVQLIENQDVKKYRGVETGKD
jgi:uncharacterized protein YbbK (DUF523 family)